MKYERLITSAIPTGNPLAINQDCSDIFNMIAIIVALVACKSSEKLYGEGIRRSTAHTRRSLWPVPDRKGTWPST